MASLRTQLVLPGLIFLLVSGSACNQKKSGQLVKSYTLVYYPKLNTYYNPADSQFLYTLDGGITWQRKQGSAALAGILDEKVTIESPLPDAWQNNEAHRRQYNGVYTNYASTTGTDSVNELEGIVEEEVKPESGKAVDKKEPEEKTRERGFKKFREKLKKMFKKEE